MERHVLVIEDEDNILEAMRFILSRDGFSVMGHGNGATAVEAVARHRPGVVVLDVMLPGRSGLDILADLRRDPATAGLPILILTAKGLERDRERAMALGANAFLTKPFSNSEMLDVVRRLAGAPATGGRVS